MPHEISLHKLKYQQQKINILHFSILTKLLNFGAVEHENLFLW